MHLSIVNRYRTHTELLPDNDHGTRQSIRDGACLIFECDISNKLKTCSPDVNTSKHLEVNDVVSSVFLDWKSWIRFLDRTPSCESLELRWQRIVKCGTRSRIGLPIEVYDFQ